MKKCLLGWIIVFALPFIGIAGYETVQNSFSSKTVDKSISFDIYKGNNYRSKVYDGTSAQIEIIVEKVRGTDRVVVWDTTFDAKKLKQYPSIENALSQNITIANLVDNKDQVEIKYLITYNSKGNILQMQSCSVILDSCTKLEISI